MTYRRKPMTARERWGSFRALPGPAQAGAWLALAIVLMLLWPLPAHADSEARNGADWVRFTARPCADAATQEIIRAAGGDPADFRAATAEFQGQAFAACWRPNFPGRVVLVIFSDGDSSEIPFALIKPVPEA